LIHAAEVVLQEVDAAAIALWFSTFLLTAFVSRTSPNRRDRPAISN
jgi:hypothetical protein